MKSRHSSFCELLSEAAQPVPTRPAGASVRGGSSRNRQVPAMAGGVGSTPSSISVSLGEHIIRISKQDFRTYERTMKVTAGHPVVAAYLEQLKVSIQFDHH